MTAETRQTMPPPPALASQWIVLARDLTMAWRGERIEGPAGTLYCVRDGARFASEFANRESDVILIDDATARELIVERDRVKEELRQAAEEARRLRQEAELAEAARQAKRDSLLAL